jgi:hypothetical protein
VLYPAVQAPAGTVAKLFSKYYFPYKVANFTLDATYVDYISLFVYTEVTFLQFEQMYEKKFRSISVFNYLFIEVLQGNLAPCSNTTIFCISPNIRKY